MRGWWGEFGWLPYDALMRPSVLKRRIATGSGAKEQQFRVGDGLLVGNNRRLVGQFGLWTIVFSVPLFIGLILHGRAIDWTMMVVALMGAYGVGLLSLPVGMFLPLLFGLVFWANPEVGKDSVQAIIAVLQASLQENPSAKTVFNYWPANNIGAEFWDALNDLFHPAVLVAFGVVGLIVTVGFGWIERGHTNQDPDFVLFIKKIGKWFNSISEKNKIRREKWRIKKGLPLKPPKAKSSFALWRESRSAKLNTTRIFLTGTAIATSSFGVGFLLGYLHYLRLGLLDTTNPDFIRNIVYILILVPLYSVVIGSILYYGLLLFLGEEGAISGNRGLIIEVITFSAVLNLWSLRLCSIYSEDEFYINWFYFIKVTNNPVGEVFGIFYIRTLLLLGTLIATVYLILLIQGCLTIVAIRLLSNRLRGWVKAEKAREAVGLFIGFSAGLGLAILNGVTAVGVGTGLAEGMMRLGVLPEWGQLLVAWMIGYVLAPARRWWVALPVAGLLMALFVRPDWVWGVRVGLVALAGYYRILPNYLVLIVYSWWKAAGLSKQRPVGVSELAYSWDEIEWVPVSYQGRLVTAAFKGDQDGGLKVLQGMQSSTLPGLRYTARKALPQIVANEFGAVRSCKELIRSSGLEHPVLPLLVPAFYEARTELVGTGKESEQSYVIVVASKREREVGAVVPRLQRQGYDVGAALEAGSAVLRERGLDNCLKNLGILQGQLPGLGLRAAEIERWKPVFERWQGVVREELQVQRAGSQGEVINPFQSGNPLLPNRAYLFKGRTAFADEIVRQLLDRGRPTLVLHGPRRCGKSSFLLNLPRLLPGEVLPVYLDLQRAAATESEGDFCFSLVQAIKRDVRSQGLELPGASRIEFQASPYTSLEDWLEEAIPKLGQRSILFSLDEFEKLGEAIGAGRLSVRLFDELRHMMQHNGQIGFLFAGVQTLEELGPNWSNYFISVRPIEMTYLELEEARQLLLDPDPAFDIQYEEGVVEQILALTRCHPYLLQLMGEAMVKQANERHSRLIRKDMLDSVIGSALTAGLPYFTDLWNNFTGSSKEEVVVGQRVLLAIANGKVAELEELAAGRQVLRRLTRYHVLERFEEGLRFEVPLIEQWVRERAIEL